MCSQFNNTSNVETALDDFYIFYHPIHGWLAALICGAGIVMNLANIVVLTRASMLSSINILLTVVAICDMGLMISYLIYLMHFFNADDYCDPGVYTYHWAVFMLLHANFSIAAHALSLWLTVGMALLRFIMVSRNQVNTALSLPKTAQPIVIGNVCGVFLCSLPNFLTYAVIAMRCDGGVLKMNNTSSRIIYTVHNANYTGADIVLRLSFWVSGIGFKIVPCILLTLFMGLLLYILFKASQRRRRLMKAGGDVSVSRTDKTTPMLVLVVLVFLLTELPQGILAVLNDVCGQHFFDRVYRNLGDVLDLLSLVNSSVNFILYCIMSRKFRQVFEDIFIPLCIRQNLPRWVSSLQTTASAMLGGKRVANSSGVVEMSDYPSRSFGGFESSQQPCSADSASSNRRAAGAMNNSTTLPLLKTSSASTTPVFETNGQLAAPTTAELSRFCAGVPMRPVKTIPAVPRRASGPPSTTIRRPDTLFPPRQVSAASPEENETLLDQQPRIHSVQK